MFNTVNLTDAVIVLCILLVLGIVLFISRAGIMNEGRIPNKEGENISEHYFRSLIDSRMKDSELFMRGETNKRYGIYSKVTKQFVEGIEEDTPMLAYARLAQFIGQFSIKYRFIAVELSPDQLKDPAKNNSAYIRDAIYYLNSLSNAGAIESPEHRKLVGLLNRGLVQYGENKVTT